MSKVLSISTAASGWVAIFEPKPGERYEQTVVLWALVEDEEDPNLRWPSSYSVGKLDPMAMDELDNEVPGFGGYEYRGAEAPPR